MNLLANNLIVLIIDGDIIILFLLVLTVMKSATIVSNSTHVLLKDSYSRRRGYSLFDIYEQCILMK